LFPITNSDLGILIAPDDDIKMINKSFFFSHLTRFFPKKITSKAPKEGRYELLTNGNVTEYVLTLIEPVDGATDVEESYIWIFKKRGDDFVFVQFKYDASS